jgi:hypothetical protein
MAKENPIHNGDSTHIQCQLITWINFNVINTIVNNPKKLIPDDELEFDIFLFIYVLHPNLLLVVPKNFLPRHPLTKASLHDGRRYTLSEGA